MHGMHARGKCTSCITNLDRPMHVVHHSFMSKLSSYLALNGIKQRAFASAIGVDPSIVSRLARNEMTPSLQLAVAIENETGGVVPATCWIAPREVEAVQKKAG